MWVVVPNLEECREQMNARFPLRDKTSDGSIGDTSHAASSSSHNPDLTGRPEYRDGDSRDEVRARDFDADLRDAGGVQMMDVIELWVTMARAGKLPHLRYLIFNRRIWHKKDNYATRAYTGSNAHDKHAHVNSDFTQEADSATGVDWGLSALGTPPTVPGVPSHPVLKVRDQGDAVRHVQQYLRNNYPSYRNYVAYNKGQYLVVDGDYYLQTQAWVKEFQRRVGLSRDGIVGPATVKAMRDRGYKY